jgi:uncharacterized membrane protein
MALKSPSPSSSRPLLNFAKRFYRMVGWIGIGLTLILSTIGAVDLFGRSSPETLLTYRLLFGLLTFLGLVFIGLFVSGLAFLVSTCIDAATHVMENGQTQTELLRRLIREQSDLDAVSHLVEKEKIYSQTELLHHHGREQNGVRS